MIRFERALLAIDGILDSVEAMLRAVDPVIDEAPAPVRCAPPERVNWTIHIQRRTTGEWVAQISEIPGAISYANTPWLAIAGLVGAPS